MPIIGPNQPFNPRAQSIQGKSPAGLGVVYGNNPAVNQQRVQNAVRKKAVNEYNSQVEEYNRQLLAYQKAVKDQQELQAQINSQIDDFNKRLATGKITFSEFQSTPYGQQLIAQYGSRAGREIQQGVFYDYVLSFPNPDWRQYGAANRKDLEYARASAFRDANDQLRLEEKSRLAQLPGYRDQQAARVTLQNLSKKPVLMASDVQAMNKAYDTLNMPRPDYTGTITRKDGTHEVYKQGLLISLQNQPGSQGFVAPVAPKQQPKIPIVSSPAQLPRTYTGPAIINTPQAKFPQQLVTYRNGQIQSSQPYFRK